MNVIKIPSELSQKYVCELDDTLQNQIKHELEKELLEYSSSDFEYLILIESTMNEKVTNLTDTIEIEFI